MKRLFLGLFLILSSALAYADRFAIPDTGVAFEAPNGFTKLSAEEIAAKYPSNRAPAFVVGNSNRTTTIAYDIKPHNLPPDHLNEVKLSFEKILARVVPGIDWKRRDIIDLQGRQWIYFEMTSQAVDTDIYNIMLITPLNKKMLVFNFNSTKKEFPIVEQELRKSVQSISLNTP